MPQICSKCSRVNPSDASYCYYDGAVLDGQRGGGPLNTGQQPFASPFVFPSGQTCANFDQLAMASQQHWAEAVNLLKQGFLTSFLGGLGRADLAMAAQEAARFPDIDRGLDQLLAKLPTQVLQAPKLKVEPLEISLGVLPMGTDRNLDLHLANQGMRLLYGSVASDSKWMNLTDAAGNPPKLFQFGDEAVVQVHVKGQHLRAGTKPLEGQLLVESNGGTFTVKVRADVPVKPLQEGVLAGATTPRQVAEKAKGAPKEAAPLFENGTVARWFAENGWTYPVQGPSASGLGAVQQFFEALGLASAPKVEISHQAITFEGAVGQQLQLVLEVKTQEKRPVYANAVCDQPWLDVSRTKLNGRIANIAVVVPSVPNRPGESLTATVNVTSNGNQRFSVPVTLAISGTPSPYGYEQPVPPAPAYGGGAAVAVLAEPVMAVGAHPVVAAVPADSGDPFAAFAVGNAPAGASVAAPALAPAPAAEPRVRRQTPTPLIHLIPALVLALALLVVIVKDIFTKGGAPSGDGIPVDAQARIRVGFEYTKEKSKEIGTSMRFGLMMVNPNNPADLNGKRLTYDPLGRTNSTVLRIDGQEHTFGAGTPWKEPPEISRKDGHTKATAIWRSTEQVQVTQRVEIIPGEPQMDKGEYKHLMDTCLVRYTIENKDSKPHRVGLRIVVDTAIGLRPDGFPNDGVPFTIPGVPGLVDSMMDFKSAAAVPDFIQVLENPDLKNPGTIAQMNLKIGGKIEPPDRVELTHWPGKDGLKKWDVPLEPIGDDSSIVLYWDEKELKAGGTRELGFTYGLGNLAAGSGLALRVGGSYLAGQELTIVGYVSAPQPGQKLKLEVPAEFTLSSTTPAEQPVPPAQAGRPSPVTWKVTPRAAGGPYEIRIESAGMAPVSRRVTIRGTPIF